MNNYQQAYKYLSACFQAKGFLIEHIVSKQALLVILDSLADQEFDRDLAQELFEQCPSNYQGAIKIENFIDVVIKADQIINQKLTTLKASIQQQQIIRKQQEQQFYTTQADSKQNLKLHVKIIEARDIFQGGFSVNQKPYIVAHCGQQKQSTKQAHNLFIWDQKFTFDIRTGSEITYVSLLYLNEKNQPQLLGEAHFAIAELQDQLIHNQWFNLYDKFGKQIPGRINLELQFTSNEAQFYKESLDLIDQQIAQSNQEILQFQSDLTNLYKPFQKQLLEEKTKTYKFSPNIMFVDQLSKPVVFQGDKKIDMTIYQQPNLSDEQVHKLLNVQQETQLHIQPETNYPAKEDLKAKANYGYDEPNRQMLVLIILALIYLLVSIFLCFTRTDFFNITIAFMILVSIFQNYFDGHVFNVFGVLLVISSIYDFIWVIIYEDESWNQHDNINKESVQSLQLIQRITIILTYSIIFLKIILTFLVCSIRLQIQQMNEHNQFGIGQNLYHQDSIKYLISKFL